MHEPETMRLTLNASETGHLVFSTITRPPAQKRCNGWFRHSLPRFRILLPPSLPTVWRLWSASDCGSTMIWASGSPSADSPSNFCRENIHSTGRDARR